MYKEDLALNNLQCLICYRAKPDQTKPISNIIFKFIMKFNFLVTEKENVLVKKKIKKVMLFVSC